MASEHLNSSTTPADYGTKGDNLLQENSESDECSIQEVIDELGNGRCQIWIALVCGLAWMCDAITMLLLPIVSVVLKCDWRLTINQSALITSLPFVGQLIGSFFWGRCSDKYGRRTILAWTSFNAVWAGILSALSPTLPWLIIHRLLNSFMSGSLSQGITLLSEFMSSRNRGLFLSLFQFSYTFGAIMSVVIAMIVIPPFGWRWYLIICALPNGITMILLFTVPESPYYLLSIGETGKALEIIRKIGMINGKQELRARKLKRDDQQDHGNLKDLFSTPDLTRSSILLAIIWFAIAICYNGIILLTAETLADGNACQEFSQDNSTSSCDDECQPFTMEAYVNMIIVAVAELPAVVISMALVDVLGRRVLLSGGAFLFAVFFALLLFCFESQSVTTLILVASKCFSQVTFLNCFTYTPEVYATPVRGLALGMGTGVSRLGSMVAPLIGQILAARSVKGAIVITIIVGLICAVASFLLPIETKGRQIQTSLSSAKSHTRDDAEPKVSLAKSTTKK